MSWDNIKYVVRAGDPFDRRIASGAHEVRMMDGDKVIRLSGVYRTRRIADEIADVLNKHAGEQIR